MSDQWEIRWSAEHRRWYFTNLGSGGSSWTQPPGCILVLPKSPPAAPARPILKPPEKNLKPGWKAEWCSKYKRYYYYNFETQQRSWDSPSIAAFDPPTRVGYKPPSHPQDPEEIQRENTRLTADNVRLWQWIAAAGRRAVFTLPDPRTIPLEASLTAVDPSDEAYVFLECMFQDSLKPHRLSLRSGNLCPVPLVDIDVIAKIMNRSLAEKYSLARDEMAQRLAGRVPPIADIVDVIEGGEVVHPFKSVVCVQEELNEVLLFHGASEITTTEISNHGFDPQRGGEVTGAMYGVGDVFRAQRLQVLHVRSQREEWTDHHRQDPSRSQLPCQKEIPWLAPRT